MSSRPKDIQQITGARRSLTEDVKARQTRYLVSMAVRTLCFILAVVTTGPLRWVFFTGSLILPYIAVVIANGGREQAQEAPRMAPPDRVAIEAPPPQSRKGYSSLYYQPLAYQPDGSEEVPGADGRYGAPRPTYGDDDPRPYSGTETRPGALDGDPDGTPLKSR